MATTNKKKIVEATSVSTPETKSAPDKAPEQPQQEKQSQLATILIGLLIVASGLLIYNYFQASTAPNTTTITDNSQDSNQSDVDGDDQQGDDSERDSSSNQDSNAGDEGSYTVAEGDSLWSIAESVYGDGHRWQEIADANEFPRDNSGRPIVEPGQTIAVPDSAASVVAGTPNPDQTIISPSGSNQASELTSYTVERGDSLWTISEQVYGDGSQWIRIYNNSANRLGLLSDGAPLIHAGNVLHIPR